MRKLISPTRKELEDFFESPEFDLKPITEVDEHFECDCPDNLGSISGSTNLIIN